MKKTILFSALLSIWAGAHAGKYQLEGFESVEFKAAKEKVSRQFGDVSKSSGVSSSNNETLYKITLNPVFISDFKDSSENGEDYIKMTSSKGVSMNIPTPYINAAQSFAESHTIDDYFFVGPLEPAIFTWLNESQLESIKSDSRLSRISEVDNSVRTISSAANIPSISGDVNPGNAGETTSWGIQAVNASGATNNQYNNYIYVVDGSPTNMHIDAKNDLNFTKVAESNTNGESAYADQHKYHIAHILGIIGAKKNNTNVAGVNPGQPIRVVGANTYSGTNWNPSDVLVSPSSNNWFATVGIDLAALDAEQNNIFSVLSLSFNGDQQRSDQETGMAMRRASNRFLVVESAGNDGYSACNMAYDRKQDNDGIVVIGGTKLGNTQMYSDFGYMGFSNPNPEFISSNAGACVDHWAPALNITSLDYFDGKKRVSSGTSYAAPFTAAVASRWGNNSTRPITREQLLKLHSAVGGVDHLGARMSLVKYGTSYVTQATQKQDIIKIWQEGSTADLPALRNGKFYPVADWFFFPTSTGSLYASLYGQANVSGVRMTLITSQNGNASMPITFEIFGGNDTNSLTKIGSLTETNQINWGPIYIPVTPGYYKVLKVKATNNASVLGYSEMEVYGK